MSKILEQIAENMDSRLTVDHQLLGSSTGTRKEQVQIPQPEILAFTDPTLCMGLLRLCSSAGILEQSMEARNREGIGLSYPSARLHRLVESIHWNRFLGSLKVLKYRLWYVSQRIRKQRVVKRLENWHWLWYMVAEGQSKRISYNQWTAWCNGRPIK